MITDNVVWHKPQVHREDRATQNGHKSVVVWFTGLSGSGKSTVAHSVEKTLADMGCRTYVLDGDNVRHGLCGDLGFSVEDRTENIRRIAELAKLFVDAGMLTFTAFISPIYEDRRKAKELLGDDIVEIFCDCSLEECERRDVKGLYKRARRGEIGEFTGINSPYEAPEAPDLRLQTDVDTLEESTRQVIEMLAMRGIVRLPEKNSATAT